MLHTGDIFETRARQHRAEELRALSRALTGTLSRLLFSSQSRTDAPMSKTERCSRVAHGERLTHARGAGCAA